MFMPPSTSELDGLDGVSRVAEPVRPARPIWRPDVSPRLRRVLKLAVAGAVIGAGLLAELGSLVELRSSEAVVSAPRITLRAPIGGAVTAGSAPAGQMLHKGDVVVRIANPRLSRLPLDELQARADRLRADIAAEAARRTALISFQTELRERARTHSEAITARFDAEIAGADADVAASAAQREQARRDLARRRSLAASGDAALADLERQQTAYDMAAQTDLARTAQRRSLEAQRRTAAIGVFAEPGANDASYATERADEIALRLLDIDQSLATRQAELAQAEALARATAADLAAHGSADIVAPADAVVWRGGAQAGDNIAAGDAVADLVLCDQSIVVASVGQGDLAHIVVGGAASVRLEGEGEDRPGHVLRTLADATAASDPRLATSLAAAKGSAIAIVSLAPLPGRPDTACTVGRSARVLLPRTDRGLLRDLLDRVL